MHRVRVKYFMQKETKLQKGYEFVMALRKQGGMTSLALEFMLLTACRTGEVAAARWDEIDLSTCIWTIPADRMKAGTRIRSGCSAFSGMQKAPN